MKKVILFFVFAVCVNSFLFSDEPLLSESWASVGFEYATFFERCSDEVNIVDSFTGSLGINFGGYRFFNGRNPGIFIHGLVAFPVTGFSETNGGAKTKTNFNDYLYITQVGLLVGPGFRFDLSEKLKFKCAAGIGFLYTVSMYPGYIPTYGDVVYEKESFSLGIGGDVGLKFDISDAVFLNIGGIFTLDFASYIDMETSFGNSSSGWAREFFMLGMRPYISVGTYLYWN